MVGRTPLYDILESTLVTCNESTQSDGKNSALDDDVIYNSTHRGLFSDWRSFGVVRVASLRRVKRGVRIPLVCYVRERCPHCRHETTVRVGANYDKNRRAAIRSHLQACPRWFGRVALPRQHCVGKLMEGGAAVQMRMDAWLAGGSAVGMSGCSYSAYSVDSNENIAISTERDDQDSNPSSASLDTTHLEV